MITLRTAKTMGLAALLVCAVSIAPPPAIAQTRAFGWNGWGQIGDGTTTNRLTAVKVTGTSMALAGGRHHSLSVQTDGSVLAWGSNDNNVLGDGSGVNQPSPVSVPGLSDVKAVAAATAHSMALKTDGTVWAWGFGGFGLGDGTTSNRPTPVQVVGQGGVGLMTDVIAIAAGGYSSYAILSNGTLLAWGFNNQGQLGNGTTGAVNPTPAPVQGLPAGIPVIAVAAGGSHCICLLSNGTVWAWGHNSEGQLGNGSNSPTTLPVQVRGTGGVGFLTGVTAIATSGAQSDGVHNLAIMSDSTVRAWGWGGVGQLGNNSYSDSNVPVQVVGPGGNGVLTGVIAITAGQENSHALLSDRTVWGWGKNSDGQEGDNTTSYRPTPVKAIGLDDVTLIAEGGYHVLVSSVEVVDFPVLMSASIKPSAVVGGTSVEMTFTLDHPVSNPINIALSNTNPAAIVPASVTIPADTTVFTLTFPTLVTAVNKVGGVTANYRGVSKIAPLTVKPLVISTIKLVPNYVTGGKGSSAEVTLPAAAPAGGFSVTLSTADPSMAWFTDAPGASSATLVVPEGSLTGSLAVSTAERVDDAATAFSATVPGSTKTAMLNVLSSILQTRVAIVSTSYKHGATVTLKATLKSGALYLAGQTIAFKVDGVPVGNGTTDASGLATISYPVSVDVGPHVITGEFAASSPFAASTDDGVLTVNINGTKIVTEKPKAPAGSQVAYGAVLTRTSDLTALAGRRLDFYDSITNVLLGSAITDGTGRAEIPVTAPAKSAKTSITVKFAGETNYAAGLGSGSIIGS